MAILRPRSEGQNTVLFYGKGTLVGSEDDQMPIFGAVQFREDAYGPAGRSRVHVLQQGCNVFAAGDLLKGKLRVGVKMVSPGDD